MKRKAKDDAKNKEVQHIDARRIDTSLYFDKSHIQLPIIFRDEYNIKLGGLEKFHPFDSNKWGNIIEVLKKKELIDSDLIIKPKEAKDEDLMIVHTKSYLQSLKWSVKVAQITEVAPAALLPNCLLQKKVLKPFRYQTGGSILGGKLAMEHNWAINIGGGFHHCSANNGGGFCAYADISLAIRFALDFFENLRKVMIIDLDAHQGNGHERDFMNIKCVYILDVYNRNIYPMDNFAKKAIKRKVEISPFTEDEEYLKKVELHVEGALNEFEPQLVVYNAGTDVLKGDPLGLLNVSAKGIIKRDEIVWTKVRDRNIPILMLTSGGYLRCTAAIIADSIANLHYKNIITLKGMRNGN
ncbi:Histone deacetylase 11 [Armadillidium vulgare]|nr:Histone deacetylase 11 [Armadillidium vulgare]